MKNNKKELSLSEKLKEAQIKKNEAEIEDIFKRADQTKTPEMDLFHRGADTDYKERLTAQLERELAVDDPEKKYHLYYTSITRMLKNFLPKGEENKKTREIIYEEKNTFLTRGHRIRKDGTRGADSRMAYTSDMEEIGEIVIDAISSEISSFDLYMKLRELNVSRGYGKSELEK